MLVVLTGPSGGGKTSTIRAGCDSFHWTVADTLTTRSSRAGFDSKVQITNRERKQIEIRPADYLITEYDQNLYINRLQDLRRAAQARNFGTVVVDWVHKYPFALDVFGRNAIGVILCPGLDILRARLEKAGRLDRYESSASDYSAIRRDSPGYPQGWSVIWQTFPPYELARQISEIAAKVIS